MKPPIFETFTREMMFFVFIHSLYKKKADEFHLPSYKQILGLFVFQFVERIFVV